MKIAFLSHSHFDGVLKVGSHHLAEQLALLGNDVFHIATPFSWLGSLRSPSLLKTPRAKTAFLGPAKAAPERPTNIVPLVAIPARIRAPRTLGRRINRLVDLNTFDYIFVDQPAFYPVVEDVSGPAVVFRPTDMHLNGSLAKADERMMQRADGLVATSSVVRDHNLKFRPGLPNMVLENGVDSARFRVPGPHDPRAGFVYVGAIDYRFDWDAIITIAEHFSRLPIRLVGPVSAPYRGELPGNVQVMGPVKYSDIPAVLAAAKVGLLPFSKAGINNGRSPMKFYEYLAAGLFIAGTRTDALASRSAAGTHLWEESAASVIAACAIAHDGQAPNEPGMRLADEYDWRSRSRLLIDFAGRLTAVR
ncbi:glycosyltransferase [Rhodococcus hoagii]|nr:glycosyltransferase [Prescottella equi]NKT15610.1 glycosyltransferase [Prescottella equi]NKW47569.1 glycosyltransferase [Prescottella equi]